MLLVCLGVLPAFAQNRTITTIAGTPWVFDGDGKPATQAPIASILGLAIDFRDNIYVADAENSMVHRIDRQGMLSVIAGTGVQNGDSPYLRVPGRTTPIFYPVAVGVDRNRNVYISANATALRWDLGGFLTRFVGRRYGNGNSDPDGTLAAEANLAGYPGTVAFDSSGNAYFQEGARIRRVRADNLRLETVAGTGVGGYSGDGGQAINAMFNSGECLSLVVDAQQNLYICDSVNRRIRKVDLRTGIITTVAGNPNAYWDWFLPRGDGGPATQAAIWPSAMTADAQGNLYIADGNRIRRFTPGGSITTYFGQDRPVGVIRSLALDSQNNLYIGDSAVLRRVTPAGVATTFAGNQSYRVNGDGGPASFASFNGPGSLAYDRASGALYISGGRRVRKVDSSGIVSPVTGTGKEEAASYTSGLPALNYPFATISGIALDNLGRLYLSDSNACGIWRTELDGTMSSLGGYPLYGCVRTVAAAPDGTIYSAVHPHPTRPHSVWRIPATGPAIPIAGNGVAGFSGDGGPALNASLNEPSGIAIDSSGRIYIADTKNHRIRRIGADGNITTIAGTGVEGLFGDGGPATQAQLSHPTGLVLDAAGNLYFSDTENHRVRVITPGGTISTFAGNARYGSGGDAGPATSAGLTYPAGLAIDNGGNVLIADSGNSVVRAVLASQPTFDLVRYRVNASQETDPASFITFSAIAGETTQSSATFLIKPSTVGLGYSVAVDSSWMSVTPNSGSLGGLTTITVTVRPNGLAPRNYEGYVTVTVPGSIPTQRRVKIIYSVLPSADLSISGALPDQRRPTVKAAERSAVGSSLSFQYTLTNNSLTVSDNVVSSGVLPSWLTFVSCTVDGGQCSGAQNGFSARLDDMLGGASARLTVNARLNVDSSQASLQSEVKAETTDLNLNNNSIIVSALFESTQCVYSLSASGTLLAANGGTATVNVTASRSDCSWSASSTNSWVTLSRTTGTGSGSINVTAAANSGGTRSAPVAIAGLTYTVAQVATGSAAPARFVSIAPCRIMETRGEYNFEGRTGPFGPPFLSAGETRTFSVPASNVCRNIPSSALAYVMNVTLVPRGGVDFVTVSKGGEARPQFFTVRSPDGLIVANSAVVPAGPGGTVNVYASNATDMLIDISGYFTDDAAASSLAFYPLTPCRVLDTRIQYRPQPGAFGPPSMVGRQTRDFRFPINPYCSVPNGAAAYSVTITAVPQGPLQFVTAWPAGTSQPNVSSLNSPNGRILANSVILPASADGSVSLHAFDTSDLIVDINGYFAPDDGVNGLYYHPVRQCRVANTQDPPGTFGGPIFEAQSKRTIPIPLGGCSIPLNAKGYALNATVIANGSAMPYLTVWPTGQPQPIASVINAFEGQTVSSGFLVPAGTNGAVDIFAAGRTHVVLEIAGYFGR